VVDGPYEITVPSNAPGDSFKLTIGLFAAGGARLPLLGPRDGNDRAILGTITVSANGQVALRRDTTGDEQMKHEDALYIERMNPERQAVNFGSVITNGAVRVSRKGGAVEVIPLPRDAAFDVALRLSRWELPAGNTARARALAADGRDLGQVRCAVKDGKLTLRVGQPGAAKYVIEPER
jgi:acyl dehydratase